MSYIEPEGAHTLLPRTTEVSCNSTRRWRMYQSETAPKAAASAMSHHECSYSGRIGEHARQDEGTDHARPRKQITYRDFPSIALLSVVNSLDDDAYFSFLR